jgi:hypothetical protein
MLCLVADAMAFCFPKQIAEASLMFILIKDVHLVGIINDVHRTHTCLRPTHQYASVQPHIHMCMSNTTVCQFNCTYNPMCTSNTPVCVSSTAHTYVYVQYNSMSIQLHIYSYVYVQHTSMRQFNRTYICVCPIFRHVLVQLQTVINLWISCQLMFLSPSNNPRSRPYKKKTNYICISESSKF